MNSEELIKLLVLFSKSDNRFDDKELVYILNVAQHLGVPQHYIESIIRSPEQLNLEAPRSEQDRMSIIYYLLFLMKIDREVSDEEIELVHHFGFKLGFSRSMINDFIDLIKEHKDSRVPTDAMLKIILKYQN